MAIHTKSPVTSDSPMMSQWRRSRLQYSLWESLVSLLSPDIPPSRSRCSSHWRTPRDSPSACGWPGRLAVCWAGCSLFSVMCTRWGAARDRPEGLWWARVPLPWQRCPRWYWCQRTKEERNNTCKTAEVNNLMGTTSGCGELSSQLLLKQLQVGK